MEQRLQKLFSGAGICSRRTAEEYLIAGRVSINGIPATLGSKADPERDIIALDGVPIHPAAQKIWIMLHKPRGFLTTLADDRRRRTVADLVKDCNQRVWPVGRLDLDSEGLLLFTNDGDGTQMLLHPSHQVEKEYHVTVSGDVRAALPILGKPMALDGAQLAPVQVELIRLFSGGGILRMILHEGRKRQIRRMCSLASLHVCRLRRVREGSLLLGDLPPGKWRYLTPQEIHNLLAPLKTGEKGEIFL